MFGDVEEDTEEERRELECQKAQVCHHDDLCLVMLKRTLKRNDVNSNVRRHRYDIMDIFEDNHLCELYTSYI